MLITNGNSVTFSMLAIIFVIILLPICVEPNDSSGKSEIYPQLTKQKTTYKLQSSDK